MLNYEVHALDNPTSMHGMLNDYHRLHTGERGGGGQGEHFSLPEICLPPTIQARVAYIKIDSQYR